MTSDAPDCTELPEEVWKLAVAIRYYFNIRKDQAT